MQKSEWMIFHDEMDEQERMESASSLVLVQTVDDKDVSENIPKMKNDKHGGAVADDVDLESGSDPDGSASRLVILILR